MALINKDRLAEAKKLKKQRIEQIRAAGVRAFMRFPYVEVTLDSVGRQAGVPEGKAELYFTSREELFLQIFTAEVDRWLSDLASRLEAGEGKLQPPQVVELVFASLEERIELLRLIGLLNVALEQQVAMVTNMIFVRKLKDGIARCSALLDQRCEYLDHDGAFAGLFRIFNYAGSLYSVGYPTGSFAMMVADDDLAEFQVDLPTALRELVQQVLG